MLVGQAQEGLGTLGRRPGLAGRLSAISMTSDDRLTMT